MKLIDHAAVGRLIDRHVVNRGATAQPQAHRHRAKNHAKISRPPHDRPPLHCGGYRPKAVNRRTRWQHRGNGNAIMVNSALTVSGRPNNKFPHCEEQSDEAIQN
jgi:hypothetical protein